MIYEPLSEIDLSREYPTFDVLVAIEKHVATLTADTATLNEVERLVDQGRDLIFMRGCGRCSKNGIVGHDKEGWPCCGKCAKVMRENGIEVIDIHAPIKPNILAVYICEESVKAKQRQDRRQAEAKYLIAMWQAAQETCAESDGQDTTALDAASRVLARFLSENAEHIIGLSIQVN